MLWCKIFNTQYLVVSNVKYTFHVSNSRHIATQHYILWYKISNTPHLVVSNIKRYYSIHFFLYRCPTRFAPLIFKKYAIQTGTCHGLYSSVFTDLRLNSQGRIGFSISHKPKFLLLASSWYCFH